MSLSLFSGIGSWPPVLLDDDTSDVIINECELMELSPQRGEGKQFVTVSDIYQRLLSCQKPRPRILRD
jgi:hypothetical protein